MDDVDRHPEFVGQLCRVLGPAVGLQELVKVDEPSRGFLSNLALGAGTLATCVTALQVDQLMGECAAAFHLL